jgi:hypothetical protein
MRRRITVVEVLPFGIEEEKVQGLFAKIDRHRGHVLTHCECACLSMSVDAMSYWWCWLGF